MKYYINIKGNPESIYPYGLHEFYTRSDFDKFLNNVDLSKYQFVSGVR